MASRWLLHMIHDLLDRGAPLRLRKAHLPPIRPSEGSVRLPTIHNAGALFRGGSRCRHPSDSLTVAGPEPQGCGAHMSGRLPGAVRSGWDASINCSIGRRPTYRKHLIAGFAPVPGGHGEDERRTGPLRRRQHLHLHVLVGTMIHLRNGAPPGPWQHPPPAVACSIIRRRVALCILIPEAAAPLPLHVLLLPRSPRPYCGGVDHLPRGPRNLQFLPRRRVPCLHPPWILPPTSSRGKRTVAATHLASSLRPVPF